MRYKRDKKAEAESRARIEQSHKEAQAALQAGKCPQCGRGVRRNNSMAGWVQCEQLGSEQFRRYPDQPSCNWQGFTR